VPKPRVRGSVAKPKLTKHQAREALKRVAAGETLREIALSYYVDHSTISRLRARHAAGLFDLRGAGVLFLSVRVS
jgi:hypothetical protein